MKNLLCLMIFTVSWEIFFVRASGIESQFNNDFKVYRRQQNFETRKKMIDFIEHAPQGRFECVEPNYQEQGICEIRNMKPILSKVTK